MNSGDIEANSTSSNGKADSKGSCSCSLVKGVLKLVLLSAILGLATNALRPKNSIDLSRNYFPTLTAPANPEVSQVNGEGGAVGSGGSTEVDPTTNVIQDQSPPDDGIQRLSFEDVRDHFLTAEDELSSTGESIVAFVDARVRDQYEDGHIPGALWLYHYESESLVDDLRPQLEMAFFIIVYCNGGDCEDSIHLAADLGSLYGLPPENVYVYEGGFNEWKDNEMPIKTGPEAR